MSPALAQRLEALSGYRHVFPPQDANARLNPVLCSHLVLSISGRRCHVLSRICDAGLDYTQRTNKFAHHVVLDVSELNAAGPARLLSMPGFMQATWDGEPRTLPTGRRAPPADGKCAVCAHWQQVTGDAGWGGVLAETAANGAARPAVLIFRPGIDPLPLLAESLALLPHETRWSVSFSTYYNKMPPGVDCQWRCVLEGSPEASAARRLPGAVIIDLCEALGAAPGGPYVQAARTGVAPAVAAAPSPVRAAVPFRPAAAMGEPELAQRLDRPTAVAAGTGGAAGEAFELDTYGIEPLSEPGAPPARPNVPLGRTFKRKKRSPWPIWLAIAVLSSVLTGAVVWMWIAKDYRRETQTASNGNPAALDQPFQNQGKTKTIVVGSEKFARKSDTRAENSLANSGGDLAPKKTTPTKEPASNAEKRSQVAEPAAKTQGLPLDPQKALKTPTSDTKPIPLQPRDFLDRLPSAVTLPDLGEAPFAEGPKGDAKALVPGNWAPWRNCQIELLGGDEVFAPSSYEFQFIPHQSLIWTLSLAKPYGSKEPAAQFCLENEALVFSWQTDSGRAFIRHPELLRNCALSVKLGNAMKTIALREPNSPPPLDFGIIEDEGQKYDKTFPLVKVPWLPKTGEKAGESPLRVEALNLPDRGSCHTLGEGRCAIALGGEQAVHFRLDVKPAKDALSITLTYEGAELGKTWKDVDLPTLKPQSIHGTNRCRIRASHVEHEALAIAKKLEPHETQKRQCEAALAKASKPPANESDDEKKKREKHCRGLKEQIDAAEDEIRKLMPRQRDVEDLTDTFVKLRQARLHYRVYIEFRAKQGGQPRVELVASAQGKASDQNAEKPPPAKPLTKELTFDRK
jgi:hypothetical protein